MTSFCLLPTSYLPPIEYFYFLMQYETIVIEQYETFPKQTLRNRAEILTDKGKFLLSIPVVKPEGNHSKTADIRICYSQDWIQKHWRAIESAYNSSPFFLYYKDELLRILQQKKERLLDLNDDLLRFFLQKLKIRTTIKYSSRFYKEIEIQPACNLLDKNETSLDYPTYHQVFSERNGFISNVSIIDLLFNKGPEAVYYLQSLRNK